jgi:phosphatidylserine/phosphatidylglycerophosphate/cardiolipin synthase-like enzyme
MRMNRMAAMLVLLILVVVGFMLYHRPGFLPATGPEQPKSRWAVYFSPRGGATQAVVKALDGAQTSVLVQAYSFTSKPIAKALLEAHKRGVKVEVILHKSQRTEQYSEADFVANEGIPTQIDGKHAIAHNKINPSCDL